MAGNGGLTLEQTVALGGGGIGGWYLASGLIGGPLAIGAGVAAIGMLYNVLTKYYK